MPSDGHRLPRTVHPHRYDVDLEAHLDEATFQGEVAIDLSIERATDAIELHAVDIEVHEASLDTGHTALVGEVARASSDERVRIELERTVPPGRARLDLAYTGQVGQAMAGLYLSEDGEDRCLVTQCEATDARRVLPCFDEPDRKARFAWTIRTDPEHTVLANGPLVERTMDEETGLAVHRFAPTRPIPSYLAALAIGEFEATDPVTVDGIPFRVWALDGKAKLGDHARDFASRLLPWYEAYFGTPYAFETYDQVAVPSFSFGAMENVGLVVFRSSLLLVDEASASWDQRKAIDRVVAHEFAHMWFGNLATMAWWDDLWLNEAFAEWIAHKAVDALEPGHETFLDLLDRTSSALETDALESTHPIYTPVETAAEALEMFDAITYGKGSAVMRMLEAYLGEEAFQEGLSTYMAAFAEDNAKGEDLWRHLAEATEEPVGEIMESWITQPGYPAVQLELTDETDGEVALRATQRRHHASATAEPADRTWRVPLVLRYEDEAGIHEHRHRLDEPADTITLPVDGELSWLVGNADRIGFYRTDLDEPLRDRLLETANALTPAERIGWLDDAFALLQSGDRTATEVLELLEALADGRDHHAVVDHVVGQIRELERLLAVHGTEDARQGLRAWTAKRFGAGWEDLGARARPSDDAPTRKRRASVLTAMARIAGEKTAVAAALEIAGAEREAPASVDADVAGPAVATAAHHTGAEGFEQHVAVYRERRDSDAPPQHVDRYLGTLPAFEDPELVDRVLGLLDDGTVPKQSIGPLLVAMLREPHTQQAAFEHLRDSWDELAARVGEAWVARIVEACGELPPDRRGEVTAFFEEVLDGSAQQSFARAQERLANRAELVDRAIDDVVAWFEQHAP